ncbi:quinone oxidoreductase family protein [Dictyobacter arantiisoli]|uniref:Zinc-binding alcohol dehydrogenase n=1 Tax=Dictyobacter arantiisoli TaxID=2014874 RepID=A0A5A5TE19_9CHLR|nr:NADP-dependent oxidoreductase [Dictyobacter arantiisoli]GCF09790.1 zinc-binding alcohol dehydrogenase [Dictyobacter arantiisoli]
MKAIGVTTFGGPEVLHVVELPEPHAGPGEVRMRVHAASVNPTDLLFRAGSQAARLSGRPGPYIPGMDAAGVIDELGPGTDNHLQIGDRVVAFVIPAGPHGGAYAEFIIVPAACVVLAPAGVDFPAASTLLLNGLTARLALDALALNTGQTVAVTGAAGAFGGYVVQLAKADGLTVIADASRSDQTLVHALGADYALDRGEAFAERVRLLLPQGVPGLADGAMLNHLALPAIADGGAMAVIRGWDGPSERRITLHKISSTVFATNTTLFNQLVQQVEQGILTLRVADVLPANRAGEAHRRLEAGGVCGRLVLDFTS